VTTTEQTTGATTEERADAADAAMRLEDVVKRFGDVVAVDHANFEIRRSEFFSLLGPSGCGKTTTLRMLAGFERPSEGRILIEGRDAADLPPHQRDTNMVFQSYALFPHMTVAQNVAFGPRRKRLPRAEVEQVVRETLATVRMDAYAGRYPRELSGGQQQRVALARALANRPAVLLLDEPLGALDLKLREEMQFELKRIQREVGISFVYVTHDQGEAITMSDRIAVMNGGRVEHLGTPEEVYLRPATRFVAGFIGQASFLPCVVGSASRDEAKVTLPGGVAAVAGGAAEGCEPGAEAVLMLRPEHVRLSASDPGTAGSFEATVVEEVFQGAVVRYGLAGPEDSRLTAITPLADRLDDAAGGRAWVSWSADWAYVLPVGAEPGEDVAPADPDALPAEAGDA
jgi:spermidine/putrescine transport system ATP-binding protein